MRKTRRGLAKHHPDALQRAGEILFRRGVPKPKGLPFLRRRVFAAYDASGSEIPTWMIADALRWRGWRQSMPAVVEPGQPMVFREHRRRVPLVPDALGLPAPPPGERELLPDLLIVPLLAFDRRGHRLGQGGGYYDRAIANLRALKPVFVLGLAYAGQEVEEIPAEPHDERLDAILTETGYIEVR